MGGWGTGENVERGTTDKGGGRCVGEGDRWGGDRLVCKGMLSEEGLLARFVTWLAAYGPHVWAQCVCVCVCVRVCERVCVCVCLCVFSCMILAASCVPQDGWRRRCWYQSSS